jgi:mercuric ion transport protein
MKPISKLIGAGVMTAIASSLCCIAPILTIVAGGSGAISTLSWMEPLRPYLIGFTALILCYVWWDKLKPAKEDDCGCEDDVKKIPIFKSTLFLGIITVFAILMTAFPYYSDAFYSPVQKDLVSINSEDVEKLQLTISGMTCEACENHVNHAVGQVDGVISSIISYDEESGTIEYDKEITTMVEIVDAVNSTGYEVTNIK